jgi:spore germination protein PC
MYYNQFDLAGYLQQLNQFIQQQQTEISRLQESLQSLQDEVKEFKTKPYTNIEKIEYKFDQLKVETLEGTLNIGLNPYNTDQIEEFAVNQGELNVPQANRFTPQIQETIQNSILQHLDQDGYGRIQTIQQRLGTPYNESYYDFMIQDVKRQLDGRIHYYLEQTKPEQWSNEERSKETVEQVIHKLKLDIDQAFTAFVQHLPKEWKDEKE